MEKIIVPSLAEPVGEFWRELQNKSSHVKNFNVASPLSSTPVPIYQWIVEQSKSFSNWDNVNFILMDEMLDGNSPTSPYVATTDAASYEGFALRNFIEPLKEHTGINIPVLKPDLKSISNFNQSIDLLVLALGVEGNYANVMPDTTLETGWHIAHLIPEFRQAHTQQGSQSYAGAEFREYGMSLGPQQVLEAKHIAVIISGSKKRDLTNQLLTYTEFNPKFPLSIIYHPLVSERVRIFISEDVGVE